MKKGENFAWGNFGVAFVMLKIAFSKHRLMKTGTTCVHKASSLKKMMEQESLQLQLRLVLGDCIKVTICWGGNDTFDRGESKLGW